METPLIHSVESQRLDQVAHGQPNHASGPLRPQPAKATEKNYCGLSCVVFAPHAEVVSPEFSSHQHFPASHLTAYEVLLPFTALTNSLTFFNAPLNLAALLSSTDQLAVIAQR